MPRLDGTGPTGAGPGTGRGLGRCVTYAGKEIGPLRGNLQGVGRGGVPWGGGKGRCFGGQGTGWYRGPFAGAASLSPAEETEALKAQLAAAEHEIVAMKGRLEEMEKKR